MSDEDMFDFDLGGEVDNVEKTGNTDQTEIDVKPKTVTKSGKKSGKKSGSVPRQQKRVPMHQRQPLSVMNRDPNFEYRVVNDKPGRIDRFKLAGWVVDEDTTVGDKIAGKASGMGSVTTAPVGGGTTGVIMKIPKELYAEDQAYKQRKVDSTEESMLSEAAEEVNKAAGGKDEWRGEIKINRAAVE